MNLMDLFVQLAGGMGTTLQIFFLTLIFSLPLGLIVAFGRMSKHLILKNIVRVYISIMRGTPLMLQLLVVYFGPYYMFGITISPMYRGVAVIIAFALNYAAYFAEIYRSGIESMPKGQYEAAKVLGYSKTATCQRYIIGFLDCLCRNVYRSEGDCRYKSLHDAICRSSNLLLYFQCRCCFCHGNN